MCVCGWLGGCVFVCMCVCKETVVPADFCSATLMLIKRAKKAAVVCKKRFSLVFSFLGGFSFFSPFSPLLLGGIYPGEIIFIGNEPDCMTLRAVHCQVRTFFHGCRINKESYVVVIDFSSVHSTE